MDTVANIFTVPSPVSGENNNYTVTFSASGYTSLTLNWTVTIPAAGSDPEPAFPDSVTVTVSPDGKWLSGETVSVSVTGEGSDGVLISSAKYDRPVYL